MQGDRAKSKPLLLRGGRGLGWSWVGLVSVGDGTSDAVKFQQTGRISCHSCFADGPRTIYQEHTNFGPSFSEILPIHCGPSAVNWHEIFHAWNKRAAHFVRGAKIES